jgi:hypothetical protein
MPQGTMRDNEPPPPLRRGQTLGTAALISIEGDRQSIHRRGRHIADQPGGYGF